MKTKKNLLIILISYTLLALFNYFVLLDFAINTLCVFALYLHVKTNDDGFIDSVIVSLLLSIIFYVEISFIILISK